MLQATVDRILPLVPPERVVVVASRQHEEVARQQLREWGEKILACGIMAMIMLRSTWESLVRSRDAYYTDYRFADVFARLKRAPEPVARRLEQIPGVALVYTRVVEDVMVPIADEPEPITGRIVSIPSDGSVPLNALHLTGGRLPEVEPSAFTSISAPGIEEQRVNVVIALERRPPALGDGFRVEARILTWEWIDVLSVPASAALRHGDGWAVYIIDEGRARLRPIQLGHRGRTDVEVTGGLADSTTVVLYPGDRVTDGARVEPR